MAVKVYRASGEITVVPSGTPMDLETLPTRDAVTIEEDEIVASGFYDGPVRDGAFPEALIRVPHVPDRKRCLGRELADHAAGFRAAPVIRNEKLEVLEGLAPEARQHQAQAARIVIGCHHYGQPQPPLGHSSAPRAVSSPRNCRS